LPPPAQAPGCQGDIGLQGKVQFRAEASAAGTRNDPNGADVEVHDIGKGFAVHLRCLSAGDNFDALATAHGMAGFRLDIGVLHEGRGETGRGLVR